MLETKVIYDTYKEYAWREYEMLERRATWIYLGNTVFVVGLGFIIQTQTGYAAQDGAMARILADHYTSALLIVSKLTVIAIPVAAIAFNVIMWGQMADAIDSLETVRLKWRAIRNDPHRGDQDLPYLSYGFWDQGPNARSGLVWSAILPVTLSLVWAAIGFMNLQFVPAAVWTTFLSLIGA